MNEFYFQLSYDGLLRIKPILCADGMWRWGVASFEDIRPDTPAFLSHENPFTLFNTTDEMEHPENYGG